MWRQSVRPDPAVTWYLFDYGMVISTAPQAADWAKLRGAIGVDLEPATSPYWTNRLQFDAGALTAREYWSEVAGRPVATDVVDELERLDAAQWSHLNPATLRVLEALQSRGARLALLSNMPVGLALRLAHAPWLEPFAHAFFSGPLGMAKPDPRVFRHVLTEIGAEPGQVVFIDDSPSNTSAAQDLGLRTVLHAPGTDLAAELHLR